MTEIPKQYKLGFQDGFIDGYNKGIDDFAILMKETLIQDRVTEIYNRLFDECNKIVEQLKE